MVFNWSKLKYMIIGMFLTVVFLFSTAQDDGNYYGNIEVERMASRIDRFIKAHGSFMFAQQTLISQQGKLNEIMIKTEGIGRYIYIDSLTYFDTKTAEIIRRN